MKTIYRVLVFGLLTMALTAVTATSLFAQDDPCTNVEAKQAVYKKFTDNFASKVLAQRKTAVEAGKEYVEKYGNCPDDKEIVAYLNKNVPVIEKGIAGEEANKVVEDRYNRFNTAIKAKNTADIYSVGKEILATDPNLVDVMLVLATAGYDQASAKTPDDKYNNEVINYATMAVQKIESGAKSVTGDYGVLTYAYKDKDNAVGWMNYIIGYIDYYRMSKKTEGLTYFYKASQASSTTKTNPFLYQTIGLYYRGEVVRLGEDIAAKLKANNNQANDEIKSLIAMQKGYADRAIDAYARAYKLSDASNKQYKDGLYESVKEIYTLRFEGKTDGVDAYIANLTSKPLPDPASKVEPVVEEDAATATNSVPAATNTAPAATPSKTPASNTTKPPTTTTKTPAPSTTKPAATPDSKKPPVTPMSSTTTKETPTKVTVTKDNTSAKKPAPKKKGTR
ncbi:MAG: hypothetical protein ABI686_13620 [Acidobacteriota bacterium]